MTDSMNFGPEWLRNLSSDGTTAGGNTGGGGGGVRYQLAEYRYGREEMLALYEKGLPAPSSLCSFAPLYSETTLPPLALQPYTEEERQWQSRGAPMGPSLRGARGALAAERGGRVPRGRGAYQPYGRTVAGYETGGGNNWGANNGGEQTEWSPRKDFSYTRSSPGGVDNWRRSARTDEDDGWRTNSHSTRSAEKISDKWSRQSSWREGEEERVAPQPDKSGRTSWHENQRGPPQRWTRENDDHLPEWATEHLGEGGGTFDSSGAFHGSDDEQEGKGGTRKDHHLQKSISQQNITAPKAQQHTPLSTSKSAISLSKPPEPPANNKDVSKEILLNHINDVPKTKPATVMEEKEMRKEPEMMRAPPPTELKSPPGHGTALGNKLVQNQSDSGNRVDEDFDKLQEDLVLKLVVEEEPAKAAAAPPNPPHSNGVIVPPPNIMPPLQEKWFYQDPQGDLQGPFLSTEMAEWFKAGYFSAGLFVRRQCDERFYTLGDLVTLCGENPFQSNVPIVPLKQEPPPPKVTEEMLQYHQMMQAQLAAAAALRSRSAYGQGEPWSSALGGLQQRELLSQQFLVTQPQVRLPIPSEPYMPQPTSGNQLFQMLNHLKINSGPPPMVVDNKPPVGQMDSLQALVHQMGGMQSMQQRTVPQQQQQQPPPVSIGGNGPPTIKHEALHGLPINNGIPGNTVLPGLPNSNSLIGGGPKPQLGKIDGDNNMNFLQFLQKPQMEQSIDLETLWRKNQYTSNQAATNPPLLQPPQSQQQWQQEQKPITMWDLPPPSPLPTPNNTSHTPPEVPLINKEKEPQAQVNNSETVNNNLNKEAAKEEKKKKETEEKRLKKEAEEKRKQEQRRAEQEKEKRRKEEERVKKELEKAKKESEEKRAREAAEKRRLKELRKAEAEEARRRAEEEEELRKSEEREKERLAIKEREEQQKRAAELARQNQKLARAAPWSQSVNNQELSLAEIQKLEKERKVAEVALMQQQQQQQQQQRLLQQQQEQQSPEKPPGGLHLSWANRPARINQQVKSLAEIQAEEQERLLKVKQATEKAQAKEKETLSPPAARIWQGQTLTWNNNDNSNIGGFWDEPQHKPQHNNKPTVNKVNPEPKVVKQQQVNSVSKQTVVNKAVKVKAKKEDHPTTNNNNALTTDDFTEWCTKTLANMNTPVDIPTFVSFLFDIESALDVREYCRDYLGDRPATQQFAAQFLEKRRLFKPKATTHKDDMCSPAPAITPSTQQHNNNSDFQEVKGKGKKCKKSKMLKVDARILGFNVTAAQDRINVGDRDYGDTT